MLTPQKELYLKYTKDFTEHELAEKLNVNPRTIRRYAQEFGIKPKPNKYRNISLDEWKSQFETHFKGKLIIVGELTRDKQGHVTGTCQCVKCKAKWKTDITHKISENTGCIHCDKGNHGNKYSKEEVERLLNEHPYGSWELIKYGNYSKKNSIIECKRCHTRRLVKLSNVICTTTLRCPTCQTGSFGEYVIANVLRYNNIPFKREYGITNNEKAYRIDFIVDDNIVVEYSGEQHFTPGFMYNQTISDGVKSKEKWAKQQGFHFFEIKGAHNENMRRLMQELSHILNSELTTPTRDFFMNTDPDMATVLDYMKTHSARQTMKDLSIPVTKIRKYVTLCGYNSISSWQLDNAC